MMEKGLAFFFKKLTFHGRYKTRVNGKIWKKKLTLLLIRWGAEIYFQQSMHKNLLYMLQPHFYAFKHEHLRSNVDLLIKTHCSAMVSGKGGSVV